MLEVASGAAALGDAARRRCARGVEERICEDDVVVHAPAEVLVEGRGLIEHRAHVHYVFDAPGVHRFVIGRYLAEHTSHGHSESMDRCSATIFS